LLSIYALDHPYKLIIATFTCSRYDIYMARQHALEHGPGQEAPVEVHTRPGRTIEAGFYEIVSFIGNRKNLHRLPSTQGKGIKDDHILLKRKRLRSTLYREFCEGRRIAGKKKPCESFFYSVFERIDGVKFSDREATECGCPHCIGMVKWGWEEISRIVEQMLPLLDIEDVTRYELKVMFEQQLEASRRWLDHGYGGDLTDDCDGIDSHCMKYALLPAEDDHTGHEDGALDCGECSQARKLVAAMDALFSAAGADWTPPPPTPPSVATTECVPRAPRAITRDAADRWKALKWVHNWVLKRTLPRWRIWRMS
jgi:hypothetical protein